MRLNVIHDCIYTTCILFDYLPGGERKQESGGGLIVAVVTRSLYHSIDISLRNIAKSSMT